MKATEAKLLDFLKKAPQATIPIYQRTYSWTERECQQLWDDILRAGANEEITAHFVGSIVYIEEGLYQVSSQTPLLVIDGQQRLTTVSLILEALARKLGDSEPMDGFSARKIRNYYLLNPEETGDKHFKLLLTQNDRDTLLALVQQKDLPDQKSIRVAENYDFFADKLSELDDLLQVCLGISKLVLVDISLSRNQDNPQLIFESMNSTGRELSQADLIRNFVLMDLEPEHQTDLYAEHWRPMELAFGQEAYGKHFDGFMRHYLTLKTGEIPNVYEVYEAFKAHARKPEIEALGVDEILGEVHSVRASLLRDGPRPGGGQETRPCFPRPTRAEGRCRLPVPTRAVPGLRRQQLVEGRLRAGCPSGRVVRLPSRSVFNTDELSEQDLRHVRTVAQEGPVLGEHPGPPPEPPVVSALPTRRGVQALPEGARSLQLPQPELLASQA